MPLIRAGANYTFTYRRRAIRRCPSICRPAVNVDRPEWPDAEQTCEPEQRAGWSYPPSNVDDSKVVDASCLRRPPGERLSSTSTPNGVPD